MATPAYQQQMVNCRTAVMEPSASPIQIPRQRDGGFLNVDQPSLPFSLEVSDWRDLSSRYEKGIGTIETSLISVSDTSGHFRQASKFIMRKIVPDAQRFETSVDMMPPLGTRVNGYNTYIARKLAQQGIHTRIVGTNQTHGRSMLHDTQANLAILQADDLRHQLGGLSCSAGVSLDLGYSMGQMKAFAKQVLAPHYERSIVLNKGIDPCVAQATGYGELLTKEMAAYFAADASLIPLNMYRNARDTGMLSTAARSRHWMKSIALTPQFAGNTFDKWRTILTGEAGTFIPVAPKDTAIVVHSFNGSQLNHRDIFETQLADFPNARFVHEEGRHLSAVCSNAVGNLATDLAAALELIESGASRTDVVEASCRPLLRRA